MESLAALAQRLDLRARQRPKRGARVFLVFSSMETLERCAVCFEKTVEIGIIDDTVDVGNAASGADAS